MATKPSPAEALEIIHELNKILDCGLDKESLSLCVALIETGVNPEALGEVIKRLRKESAKIALQDIQKSLETQDKDQTPRDS